MNYCSQMKSAINKAATKRLAYPASLCKLHNLERKKQQSFPGGDTLWIFIQYCLQSCIRGQDSSPTPRPSQPRRPTTGAITTPSQSHGVEPRPPYTPNTQTPLILLIDHTDSKRNPLRKIVRIIWTALGRINRLISTTTIHEDCSQVKHKPF